MLARAFEYDPPFVWMMPDGRTRLARNRRFFETLGYVRAFGRRLGRAASLSTAMARAHPHQPHWYLYAIGVDPARPGSGTGGALLRSRLARCDQQGQPAYLESSKLANVPLYQHFGFEPAGPFALPAGAQVLTPIWRAAAAARHG